MGPDAWITLGVVALVMGLLVATRYGPEVIMLGGLTLLLTLGVIDGHEMLSGIANPGVVTVGVLFVVAEGLKQTGGIGWLAGRILGRPRSETLAQGRIMLPVAGLSAFMNNTPLVAMMMPVINDWARRLGFANSRLMIPLSFASILGGACTLIGTSTTLVYNGLIIQETERADAAVASTLPAEGLGMFTIAVIGLPCAVAGMGFILVCGRRLLPDRKPAITLQDDPRRYTVEMLVDPDGPLVGQTIEQAGLRQLPGLFLMEIDRGNTIIPAAGPTERLQSSDRLVFAGVVESVVDLQKIRGLLPATDQVFKLESPRSQRCLVEAVVSDTCPLVGRSIREGQFRTRYNAVVIAVARSGQRIHKKIGDIVLRSGDTLLLETTRDFAVSMRDSRDFYLVSQIADSTPPRHDKAGIAVVLLAALVAVVAGGWLSMLNAALICAGLMILTRCCSASAARRSIDWQVLLVIAAAIGIGKAMDTSGLAHHMSQFLLGTVGASRYGVLVVLCALTMFFANISNAKAAAVLMFPVAVAAAADLNVSAMPYVIATLLGAVYTFATPIGFQTNLMVYGPGGYRFTDYLKIGIPLSILLLVLTVWLVPMIWAFQLPVAS